jgi:hypothetical protein
VAAPLTPSAPATPTSAPDATTHSATPTSPKPTGKDVDHPVCLAVRSAMLTAQQKAVTDKNEPRRLANDFKGAATALRTQAQKTKNTDLKTTLGKIAAAFDALGADVAAGKPTDADQKKIADVGPHLDELCPQKA